MRGYGAFAWYYDELTENVSYQKRADYFLQLIEKFGSSGPIVLDLACGTGSLSMELAQRGCDVIGVDASEDMLSVAQEKAMEHPEWDILYLCQSMTELDLFGTVDTTICALDSINHLTDPRQVQQTFQKVSLFTAPGGLFYLMRIPRISIGKYWATVVIFMSLTICFALGRIFLRKQPAQ